MKRRGNTMTEEKFYEWRKTMKGKEIVVKCNGYGCYSTVDTLKEAIDNEVEEIRECEDRILIYLEDGDILEVYSATL